MIKVYGSHGVNDLFVPNLEAELIPSKEAASFTIGTPQEKIDKMINSIKWYDKYYDYRKEFENNESWIGYRGYIGNNGDYIDYYCFGPQQVVLQFSNNRILYKIDVGNNYKKKDFVDCMLAIKYALHFQIATII